jgi:hypothetical protein
MDIKDKTRRELEKRVEKLENLIASKGVLENAKIAIKKETVTHVKL